MTEETDKDVFRTAREYARAHESATPDPEACACVLVVSALEPLNRVQRERVLKYINGRYPDVLSEFNVDLERMHKLILEDELAYRQWRRLNRPEEPKR